MARKENIKFLMKQELNKMEAYGQSKFEDQVKTQQERQMMKRNGYSRAEIMEVNYSKDKIYSFSTMKTYQSEVNRFCSWLSENNLKKLSLNEAKDYIQPYIDHQTERGLSPYSINTSLSALCKALHTNIYDYDRPRRSIANVSRGKGERPRDKSNEKRAEHLLQANRLLGLRRAELERLKAKDFEIRDNVVVVHSVGKGGKHNEQRFYIKEEQEKVLSLIAGKNPEDKVFSKDEFYPSLDLHHMRELRAKDLYNSICEDMKNRPEARDEYKEIIHSIFEEHNKTLREDLDMPYHTRGSFREHLISENRDTSFDRVGVLMVSLCTLSHFRSDTSVNYYIGK